MQDKLETARTRGRRPGCGLASAPGPKPLRPPDKPPEPARKPPPRPKQPPKRLPGKKRKNGYYV